MSLALQDAAIALGWRGLVVPDVAVLGHRVSAVVRLRKDVHAWRTRNGCPPDPDPSWFRTWFEPESRDRLPVAAVDLVGVLVGESAVDRALQSCGTLLTLAPCAAVLPAASHADAWQLVELDYYGVGVVIRDENAARVLVPPEDRSAEFGPSLFGRWLLEVLYDRVTRLSVVAPSQSSR